MIEVVARGDGVGIEVAGATVRGVRLRHDVDGRLSSAVELPFRLDDDATALDTLVLLRAELGEPLEPTRIATFPPGSMLQRIDITGRSGPELNDLRSKLDRLHGITSSVVVDDGPRRWIVVIRWDARATRRLEDLAERAGFVDVAVEPTPMAVARVAGRDATYVRRFVGQGDTHHAIVSNRLPVAALSSNAGGRGSPAVDISSIDVTPAHYDDFLGDAALGEVMDRVARRVEPAAPVPALDLVGEPYPAFPEHDLRAASRQVAALGAAVGAAGLAGPMRPVDVNALASLSDQSFDRPWAIEAVSALPDVEHEPAVQGVRRLTRRLRPRSRR
ncbi:hypothetical protein [Ilumatobacter sp.]|uniref:hypothetical protein n=1 Tax=Ilumatobacter sp. TaxID=1967498 RepID=UPI003B5217F2